MFAFVGLIVLLAAGYGVHSLISPSHARPFENFSVNKVTETGAVVDAALSPDGKYILSLVRDKASKGLASLWLRNVPTNSMTQVQLPADVWYNGLRFSTDSNYFYSVHGEPGNAFLKSLYRSPLLGGTPERLAVDVDSNVTFSPDGRKLAFIRSDNPEPGKYRLIVRSVDNGDETVLTGGPNSEALYSPAWSPDGKTIMCAVTQPGDASSGLMAVDVGTGQQHLFMSSADSLGLPTWMPDGRGLLFLDADQASNYTRWQITFASYPQGTLNPVTRDTNSYSDLSLASNGKVLATVLNVERWNLFVMSATSEGGDAKQLDSANSFTNFTWTRDGRLIDDKENGLRWINPDSGAMGVFPTDQNSTSDSPSACADGRYFVFMHGLQSGKGGFSVWRTDSAGENLRQLSHGRRDFSPVCSPDSRWVYYIDAATGQIARVPIDGGTAQKVTDLNVVGSFDVSPDGGTIAFATIDHAGDHEGRLALIATDTGKGRLLKFERDPASQIRFSPDGKAVVYAVYMNGIENLWRQPIDGSAGKQLTTFTLERISDFHWSFDGKQLALIRGHNDSDVVLIRDAKN